MENNLIMFNSMTSAMKGRDLLKKHKIISRPIRTPSHLNRKSCGYSLLVKHDFNKALDIIKNHNLNFIGVSAVDFP